MHDKPKQRLLSRSAPALRDFSRNLARAMRLMVGVPDYDTYVAHVQKAHPERPVMTREQFFRNRQAVRFTGPRGGCC
jgi:uncharacterized short protein YbdD (DUF466 family)